MSDSSYIPVVGDKEIPVGQDAAKLDAEVEKSEETGKIPQSEVDSLKDSLGGGEVLDNEAGVSTRGVENDAYKQEKEIDEAIGEE